MAFTTRLSLIQQMANGNEITWQDFYNTYKPLIYLRGRDRGLNDEELKDLCQESLLSIFNGKDKFVYDRSKGRFRNYLKTIVDRRAFAIIKKRNWQNEKSSVIDQDNMTSSDFDEMEENWDRAWQEKILNDAMEVVKGHINDVTFQAFKMTYRDGVSTEETAEKLGISTESVYVAKHRTLKRLQVIISQLTTES